MKINEIAIPKKISGEYAHYVQNDNYAFGSLTRKLATLGWKVLSHGHFSTVYTNLDKSYVLKVNKMVDPAYQHYVDFITKNKNNKYLPRIVEKEMFSKDGYQFYVYFIEKLEKCTNRSIINVIAGIAYYAMSWKYDTVEEVLAEERDFYNKKELISKIDKKFPKLLKTAFDIGKYSQTDSDDHIWLDIRTSNVLQRKDGTPVITDPYYS